MSENTVTNTIITLDDLKQAHQVAIETLDKNFFKSFEEIYNLILKLALTEAKNAKTSISINILNNISGTCFYFNNVFIGKISNYKKSADEIYVAIPNFFSSKDVRWKVLVYNKVYDAFRSEHKAKFDISWL